MRKQIIDKIFFKAKLRLLKLHYESKLGHLGGNLSSIDCLLTLYHMILNENDLFVLSKGHSACALYISLWSKGLISEKTLKTYGKDGTVLPAHPSGKKIPGLLFSTGSLGHGPSLSAGLAIASKLKNKRTAKRYQHNQRRAPLAQGSGRLAPRSRAQSFVLLH